MSDEGARLVARVALLLFMLMASAVVRALVGPGKARGRVMLVATVGGIAAGMLVTWVMSGTLDIDLSALGATLGIVLGWCVGYRFAMQIPRDAD
jgi:hypothetical protein